jgi:hypothetical protein
MPPYNRVLKTVDDNLVFLNLEFKVETDPQNGSLGPMRYNHFLKYFLRVKDCIDGITEWPEEWIEVDDDIIIKGIQLFREQVERNGKIPWWRLVIEGYQHSIEKQRQKRLLEEAEEDDDGAEEEVAEEEVEKEWSPEDISRHVRKLLAGLGRKLHRGRWLRRLAHSQVIYKNRGSDQSEWNIITVRGGLADFARQTAKPSLHNGVLASAESQLNRLDHRSYDRLSVLFTEYRRLIQLDNSMEISLATQTLDKDRFVQLAFPELKDANN